MADFRIKKGVLEKYNGHDCHVVIPDSVTKIDRYAFSFCYSFSSVVIPDSVTEIGFRAFEHCARLASVVIPDSVTGIVALAFEGCSSLASVVIPDSVTEIGDRAFEGCSSLASVVIPDSVTEIGDRAFSGCSSLSSVVIPDSVTEIGWRAFEHCSSLASVVVSNGNRVYRSQNDCLLKGTTLILGCMNSVIPDSVTEIGSGAFYGCSSLSSVVIPDSVTEIGSDAFSGCSSLSSVVIPDSVTEIGWRAFEHCSSLASVVVSNGNRVYRSQNDCLLKGTTLILGCMNSVIPDSVTEIGSGAFYGCSSLSSVVIPDSVTKIGERAFEDCSSLSSVVIHDSVTEIDYRAFKGCSSLSSVVIPDSVTTIGGSAFYGCSSLSSVVIPDSVTTIGGSAFFGCSSLSSVVIPAGVTKIDSYAFRHCSSLSTVVIPASVTTIGYGAFEGCSSLSSVVIPDSVTKIGWSAFEDCSSLSSVVIHDSVTEIDSRAFYGCSSLSSVVIPDSVTEIGKETFKGCSSLSSVVIPDSVTKIGSGAFKDCSSLSSVVISTKVVSIDSDTFRDCPKLVPGSAHTAALLILADDRTLPVDADDALVAAIGRIIEKRPKNERPELRRLLLPSTTHTSVAYFERLGMLDEYAEAHHTSADTLRDTVLSDFGLDAMGCIRWTLAGRTITARLQKDLSLALTDDTGKILKSVPKKGADPEAYEAVKKAFAQLKKDIRSAAKLRNDRLLVEFLEGSARTASAWKTSYLGNPLLTQLARLIVWQQGAQTFTLNEAGAPVDASGAQLPMTEEPIRLAHPVELGAELTAAWQGYFTARRLAQPFAQVWEPIMDPASITPDRYRAATIPLHYLMSKDRHGITMEGQSRLRLKDCSADLRLVQGHTDWVNNEFEITDLRFDRFTRYVNHIVAHFDKGTVQGRLLKDDVSAVQWLDRFTLPQITDLLAQVTAKGDCPNATAALLEYKHTHWPETESDALSDFVLDW